MVSPNQGVMDSARRFYDSGKPEQAAQALEGYLEPDPVYDREKALLYVLTRLAMAEQAIAQGRERYAQELLEQTKTNTVYCPEALERQRLLLLGRISGAQQICALLPSLDEELQLRAEASILQGEAGRGAHLLEAMQHQDSPKWMLLRGEAYLAQRAYQNAIPCFLRAETAFPEETAPKLEHCYRELGDYKQAYLYACKQKKAP